MKDLSGSGPVFPEPGTAMGRAVCDDESTLVMWPVSEGAAHVEDRRILWAKQSQEPPYCRTRTR